jgi:hypothetical protein
VSVLNEREIIQIAATGNWVLALCNDGSLWVHSVEPSDPVGWEMIPRVPRRRKEPAVTKEKPDDDDIPL